MQKLETQFFFFSSTSKNNNYVFSTYTRYQGLLNVYCYIDFLIVIRFAGVFNHFSMSGQSGKLTFRAKMTQVLKF